MKEDCLFVFVYGSLRSGFNNPAYSYISQYFDLVSPARVVGTLFENGEVAVAVPLNSNRWIIGELYRIRHEDEFAWAIAQLDDYEGLNPGDDSPCFYKREKVQVQTAEGEVQAHIYWYSASVEGLSIIESGDVLAYYKSKI
jgi:gamma-glutamylcyclotransferase (GGCT)/AIG2-like uncharacterized protein YtfP